MANDFLPIDKLPECWNDETRMNVLFAPFRSRSANPQDWESKLSFWKGLIYEYCIYQDKSSFKLDELRKVFTRNGRSPSCLKIVIEEMYKIGEIIPLNSFNPSKSTDWSGWLFKPLFWSYNLVKSSIVSEDIEMQSFVCLNVFKNQAEMLLSSIPDKLINLEQLLQINESNVTKSTHYKLLLSYLYSEGKIDIKKLSLKEEVPLRGFLIKLTHTKHEPISDLDTNIYMLQMNETVLLDQVEKLEKNVNELIEQTKSYLRKGHRQMAKGSLRKKHEVEKRITKKADALHNVQLLLSRLSDSEADAEILKAYKTALSSLQNTFKNGLNEDNVTDTMLELGELLDIHQDIEKELAKPLSDNDADLEEELAQLLLEEQRPPTPPPPSQSPQDKKLDEEDLQRRFEKLTANLPNVPFDNPNSKPVKL